MATYSVNNIKIDNGLYFSPGPTAGNVLSINGDGSTTWISAQSGTSGSSGTSGANGQSSSLFLYKAKTNSYTNNPGNSYILWNNATQTGATAIHINHLTQDNIDIDIFLGLIRKDSNITIQHRTNSSQYQTWNVSATPTLVSGADNYWIIPVSLINSTISFTNNNDIFVAISADSGTSGSSGSSGTSGVNGGTGSSGTSGIGSSGTSGINGATGSSSASAYGVINSPILNQGFKPMMFNNLWSNVITGTDLISQSPSIDGDAVLIPFRTPVVLGITGIGTICQTIGSPAPSVRFICYANNNTFTKGFLVNGPTTRIWRTNATSPASSGSFFSATQSYTFQPGTTYWVGYEIVGSGGGTTRLTYIPNSALESTGVDPANLKSGVGSVGPQDTTPFSSINYKTSAVLYMEFTGCSASATS
jgi:hypothetical protein